MPNDKRARQRANRDLGRQQAAAAKKAAARHRTNRYYITVGVVITVIVLVGALFASTRGSDDDDVSTDTTLADPTDTTLGDPAAPCTPPDPRPSYEAEPPMSIDTAKTYTATLTVASGDVTGDVVVELDDAIAPETVSNFVTLARDGYYDCTQFHRIIPGFMIQGGDPTATGTGGPGYEFRDELPPEAECDDTGRQVAGGADPYPAGSLAMANSGPGTNGSQFFIVTGDASHLCTHTRFGTVTGGLDVAAAIEALGDASGVPTRPAYLVTVTIAEA
jgi:cyclophilin family peptidyl-prolyl cis-trans isomerase